MCQTHKWNLSYLDIGKDPGEGQAPFLGDFSLAASVQDLGVDQDELLISQAPTRVVHHQPHIDPHLRRCQAHAIVPAAGIWQLHTRQVAGTAWSLVCVLCREVILLHQSSVK